MPKRFAILIGMGLGAIWAVMVVWLGPVWKDVPLGMALAVAGVCAGLPLLLMIGRLAQRRFFDDALIDGGPLSEAAGIDDRVLRNTVEQCVLAACIWPLAGLVLGSGTVLTLGAGFLLARLAFWLGYHLSPPLRAFGFAASFYPTVLVACLVLREAVRMLA
ncbi:MAPEG family protein [Mameliella sediminis]|uniref:MAPEG family protein n=1 Tax=Mameliella sediminis TaxID=2836866 RepID=UPI001FE7BAFA|nr:MAPEG family protein [Mameliella sediminis]